MTDPCEHPRVLAEVMRVKDTQNVYSTTRTCPDCNKTVCILWKPIAFPAEGIQVCEYVASDGKNFCDPPCRFCWKARVRMIFGNFFTRGKWAKEVMPVEDINAAIDCIDVCAHKNPYDNPVVPWDGRKKPLMELHDRIKELSDRATRINLLEQKVQSMDEQIETIVRHAANRMDALEHRNALTNRILKRVIGFLWSATPEKVGKRELEHLEKDLEAL